MLEIGVFSLEGLTRCFRFGGIVVTVDLSCEAVVATWSFCSTLYARMQSGSDKAMCKTNTEMCHLHTLTFLFRHSWHAAGTEFFLGGSESELEDGFWNELRLGTARVVGVVSAVEIGLGASCTGGGRGTFPDSRGIPQFRDWR